MKSYKIINTFYENMTKEIKSLKKLIKHPIFIAILPVFLFCVCYIIEIGYFESKGININLIKIDFINLLRVGFSLTLCLGFFFYLYCIFSMLINFQFKFKKKHINIILEVLKAIVLFGSYIYIFKNILNDFNVTSHYDKTFIFIFIIMSTLIYFLITLINPKPLIYCYKILNIICILYFALTLMYLKGVELGNDFKGGKIYFNGKKYQILRVYNNSILAATGEKNNYTSYIEIPKDNEFILKN